MPEIGIGILKYLHKPASLAPTFQRGSKSERSSVKTLAAGAATLAFPRRRDCESIRFSWKRWDKVTIFYAEFCIM